jgi:uncharacterized protein (TIGR00645 family)
MMERAIEKLLFASRWIMAPVYLGLSLALVALGIKFFMELFHLLTGVFTTSEADLVLVLLALVDMVLVGSLIVMVMFSGYENFVSALDVDAGGEKLSWLGKLDANSLKLKVASSIVAISSIHLLRAFMKAPDYFKGENAENGDNVLMWFVIIHLTFVASAVMMGVLDRITSSQHRGHKGEV